MILHSINLTEKKKNNRKIIFRKNFHRYFLRSTAKKISPL